MAPHETNRVGQYSRLLAIGAALLITNVARGQQFMFGAPTGFELTAPQLDKISGAEEARLEQVRALVADHNWDETVETLRDVANTDADRLVAVNEGAYLPLATYCQLEVSRLPAEGLAAYRQRVDATAEKQYRDGLAARDPALLGRVVDEAFCSSWGDDTLMALGELALERADYAGARRAWQAISPQLRDPLGRPEWVALADVDLSAHWPRVAARWQEQTMAPDWLVYPDTNIDLADVRARLVLASIREGDFERAKLELEVFRRLHPQAAGRLAGEEGPYVPALVRLLKSARSWPTSPRDNNWATFAEAPTRNAVAPAVDRIDFPAWSEPVKLPPVEDHRFVKAAYAGNRGKLVPVRETEQVLAYYPLVVGSQVFFNDARRIHAVDLATGKSAVTPSGVLYHLEAETATEQPMRIELGPAGLVGAVGVSAGVPRYTMSYADGILYARVGEDATGRNQSAGERRDERLLGVDLNRDGLLTFEVKPDDGSWSFDGAPVCDSGRVYVTMQHSDVKPHVFVACFDSATGRRLWRTSIAAADTPGSGRGDEITHNLLTLAGDRVFINSNLGVVAAVVTGDGRIAWLRRYDRAAGTIREPRPLCFDRDPSPCVYDHGMLFVAPVDAPTVFALDADTGQTLWATDQLADVVNLLGVVKGNLIASGHRLVMVDSRSGQVRFIWPESETAGIRGFGRGVVAGREVFWPSRDKIYVFSATTGQQTREPIDVSAYTNCGANLVAAEGHLLLATHDKLMALGPNQALPTKENEGPKRPDVAVAE